MPPGKPQDVLCLFCSFLFFFKTRSKSTFLCRIWSKMCPQKRTKKIMIFVFFDLLCSFLFFFVVFSGFGLQNVLKQRTKKDKKDHAAGKIARCPLSFLLLDPPPPSIFIRIILKRDYITNLASSESFAFVSLSVVPSIPRL